MALPTHPPRRIGPLSLAALSALAVSLNGCALNDHFADQVGRINSSLESSRHDMLLANIVRASMSLPLEFSNISKVSGDNTISSGLGLPSIMIGPGKQLGDKLYTIDGKSVTSNNNTSFDVTPQISKEFYQGITTPIEEPTVAYFLRQGADPETLYKLIVESVTIYTDSKDQSAQNCKSDFINKPGENSKFNLLIAEAVKLGLTIETVTTQTKLGVKLETKKGALPPDKLVEFSKSGLVAAPIDPKKPGDLYDVYKIGQDSRICFNTIIDKNSTYIPGYLCEKAFQTSGPKLVLEKRKEQEEKQKSTPQHNFCANSSAENIPELKRRMMPAKPILNSKISNTPTLSAPPSGVVDISSRSVYGMFQFLGGFVKEADKSAGATSDFVILKGVSGAECAMETRYRGENYCVPTKGGEKTLAAVTILSQLINLNTNFAEMQTTPTLRLR